MRRPTLTNGMREKLLTTVAFLAQARQRIGPDQFTDKDVQDAMKFISQLAQSRKRTRREDRDAI